MTTKKTDDATCTITIEGEKGPFTVNLADLENALSIPYGKGKIPVKNATEWLPCKLTQEEILDRASDMAANHSERERLASELAQIQTEFKGCLKRVEADINCLSLAVANKEERRNVRCQWWMHFPRKGEKTLVRLDSGEKVRTAIMSEADAQGSLFEEQA